MMPKVPRESSQPFEFDRVVAKRLLALVLGLGALVRLIYFLQLASGPCLYLHRWNQSDMHFFDHWARLVAEGDWLTDQALHPLHHWTEDLALRYLEKNPKDPAHLAAAPATALWNRWYGEKQFHQGPVYPYLLATVYSLLGADVRWCFVLQLFIGLMSLALIYWVTLLLFGQSAALVAGIISLLYAPLLFYELVLLRCCLIVFVGWLLILLTLSAFTQAIGRVKRWSLLGLGLGVAILTKAIFWLYALGVFVALGMRFRGRERLVGLACLGLSLGLALSPALVRNLIVGAPVLSFSSVGVMTFVNSNASDTHPDLGDDASQHLLSIMPASSGSVVSAVVQTLATHSSLGAWLAFMGKKLLALFGTAEIPNNVNFYFYRTQASILYLPFGFWLVAPLGLVGLVLGRKRFRSRWCLYWLVACSFCCVLCFAPLSRQRLPFAVCLIPFASLSVVQMGDWLRNKRFGNTLAVLVVFLLFGVLQLAGRRANKVRSHDYIAVHEAYYKPLEQRAIARQDFAQAFEVLADFQRLKPDSLQDVGVRRAVADEQECIIAYTFGQTQFRAGLWLQRLGKHEQSQSALAEGQRLIELSLPCLPQK